MPEVIAFLSNSLLILAPHRSTSTSLPGFFPVLDAFRPELTDLKLPNKKEEPVSRLSMSSSASPNAASLLQMTFALIDRFAQSWVLSVASVEMLQPLLVILQGIKTDSIHSSLKVDSMIYRGYDIADTSILQESLTRTATALERMLNLSRKERKPLRLQHHKPVPIPTFIPKFEEGYQPGRPAFDPDTARNEEAKLKSLVKKERKGAIRELRKDNRFIAEERAKMRDEKDKAYNTRINTIRAGLDAERAEEKDYQRSKAKIKSRDRRRAGGR